MKCFTSTVTAVLLALFLSISQAQAEVLERLDLSKNIAEKITYRDARGVLRITTVHHQSFTYVTDKNETVVRDYNLGGGILDTRPYGMRHPNQMKIISVLRKAAVFLAPFAALAK